ncbi:rod shape-determining protein MreC [Chroococcidiopsis thermalis]|uniref:Cell shape-determining protein MreC n=1 Tax=Chroococcidiopsis thermalis (strain PCC 7203) TaxID=251229 RepID=K9U4B0_CHRTP|nr:rod shape-determining protein MreC [Chroococcidiopsis thermalis]AFY89468.1 rod shape-determining protein MreC [Chroococcidiopsis thermalis PCC 7203]PSB47576.1 rod shape-determining protein MreC [Cyanosarcina cf. burmensis CCALA 770]
MYIERRQWWEKRALPILLCIVALGTAWTIRQTQAALIFEIYQLITLPFHRSVSVQAERLSDAQNQELQAQLAELKSQNQQLKKLLSYESANNLERVIVAPVIGRSADQWWQQITLGRGTSTGIKVGDIVTAPGGLVGKISSVTPNTSRVLLISDRTSQLGVTVSRSRHTGFLRGLSESQAVMQFFDKVPDVKRGDAIVTSTYSQIYPAGLPVGKIESIDLNKSPAPEAIVSFSAPIPHLEWAVVYAKSK